MVLKSSARSVTQHANAEQTQGSRRHPVLPENQKKSSTHKSDSSRSSSHSATCSRVPVMYFESNPHALRLQLFRNRHLTHFPATQRTHFAELPHDITSTVSTSTSPRDSFTRFEIWRQCRAPVAIDCLKPRRTLQHQPFHHLNVC